METSYLGRTDLPLGLRNNNPGNLRPGDAWQGMTGVDSAHNFIIFKSIPWGVRAMATDLVSKINEGLDTITKIVNKYAPESDNNDVQAYINDVSNISGFDPNQTLTPDGDTIFNLVKGHISHENGAQYASLVSDADIQQGMSLMSNPLSTFSRRQ